AGCTRRERAVLDHPVDRLQRRAGVGLGRVLRDRRGDAAVGLVEQAARRVIAGALADRAVAAQERGGGGGGGGRQGSRGPAGGGGGRPPGPPARPRPTTSS